MDLCKYTEELWKLYFSDPKEDFLEEIYSKISRDVVIIGTGSHEFYEDLEHFVHACELEAGERSEIRFEVTKIWCREKKIDENVSMVSGEVWVKGWGRKKQKVIVDMDSRFSVLYKKEEGQWKVAHIHQSLPNYDQRDGEFFPKTLMDQVAEARQLAEKMEQLAKTDQLTKIYNNQTFYDESVNLLQNKGQSYCMAIDLDDFKLVNDTYGHLEGDKILTQVGRILKEAAKNKGIAGRMGGDEFALFCTGIDSDQQAEKIACQVLEAVGQISREMAGGHLGVSVGIAKVKENERVKEAFRRADEMLYEVKRSGKNHYKLSQE